MYVKFATSTAFGALMAGALAIGSAYAGQEPFLATVCDDTAIDSPYCNEAALGIRTGAFVEFYKSPKEVQFTHTNQNYAVYANETFRTQRPINQAEYCDVGLDQNTNRTSYSGAFNSSFYEYDIVLPKKPNGDLNINIQCSVLKPQETDINFCAGETGEFQGPGRCNPAPDRVNAERIKAAALPTISAVARPGPYASVPTWLPFNLTAMKNPSNYALATVVVDGVRRLDNGGSMQVLDQSSNSRFALKACFTKTIFVKKPVEGQINKLGQTEANLEAGDLIRVRLNLPSNHTMDVRCHAQSVSIAGIGEPFTLLD